MLEATALQQGCFPNPQLKSMKIQLPVTCVFSCCRFLDFMLNILTTAFLNKE